MAMMNKLISCMRNKENSLLESPTGSGKTLALLCASLAWQKKEIERIWELARTAEAVATALDQCDPHVSEPKTEQMVSPGNSASEIPTPMRQPTGLSAKEDKIVILDSDEDTSDFQPEKRFRATINCQDIQDTGISPKTLGNPNASVVYYVVNSDTLKLPQNLDTTVSNIALLINAGQILVQPEFPQIPVAINPTTIQILQSPSQSAVSQEQSVLVPSTPLSQTPSNRRLKNKGPENYIPPQRPFLPKIFYCTRTHKQVKQIIQELSRTSYRDAKMCILSSREQTCIHPHVSKQPNKKEGCQTLLKDPGGIQCSLYLRSRGTTQDRVQFGGLNTAWDLEDMVQLGKKDHFCPYFGLRELLQDSDIIFCPYNYLTDPLIRSSMEINLKGHVVIFDEAHNIEDFARDAASFSVNEDNLVEAIQDLETYQLAEGRPFANVFSRLSSWISRNSKNMTDYCQFDRAGKIWSGQELVAVMTDIGAGPSDLGLLKKQLGDLMIEQPEKVAFPVASNTLQLIKGFLLTLDYLYRKELKFMKDYRGAIVKSFSNQRQSTPASGWRQKTLASVKSWTHTLNFWCLNPGVCFSDFQELHSLIVTSGTLSPIASFESELCTSFPVSFEANHVVGRSQVWVGTVGCGPSGIPLKAVYQSMESFQFQDELGSVVLQVCQTVPHGVLCFFPSYSNLEKMMTRWQLTGLWDRLEALKVVVVEPRGNDKAGFAEVLEDFYSAVEGTGALFMAVYRGKVSEGLNFADNNARAVITIGIPYPNFKDIQVNLKQKYNDEHCRQRSVMNGRQWYEAQAFRALNQALGRCIRHKNDWGALILVDQRFQANMNYTKSLSKWVRQELRHYPTFSEALDSLEHFTKNAQATVDLKDVMNVSSLNNDIAQKSNAVIVPSEDQENVSPNLQVDTCTIDLCENSNSPLKSSLGTAEDVSLSATRATSSPELF